jgi:electron transfer flavoprotein alpha subunit
VTAECPPVLLAPGTSWGRHVAGRVAARLGIGLIGDAVDLDTEAGRLVCWKPAFGGRMVAAITSSSPVQIATLRPGILEPAGPDLPAGSDPELQVDLEVLQFHARGRVQVLGEDHHDDAAGLLSSRVVVAVGQGVDPDHLGEIDQLVKLLGAQWAATRKVTDRGWMPRSRQVGLTGHSLAPVIYLAIGVSGKFNHMVGTRAAACVVAVNSDPAAAVFDWADIGLVGDWREIVPCLTDQLARL